MGDNPSVGTLGEATVKGTTGVIVWKIDRGWAWIRDGDIEIASHAEVKDFRPLSIAEPEPEPEPFGIGDPDDEALEERDSITATLLLVLHNELGSTLGPVLFNRLTSVLDRVLPSYNAQVAANARAESESEPETEPADYKCSCAVGCDNRALSPRSLCNPCRSSNTCKVTV